MRVNLVKLNGALYPSLDTDAEQLAKIKQGQVVCYEIKRPRNGGFHRKYFALLGIVVDNCDYNLEQLLHIIKLKLGHFEQIINTNGKVIYIPKSISFAKMDQDQFEEFYSKTINVILKDFIPDTDEAYLNGMVNQIVGFA